MYHIKPIWEKMQVDLPTCMYPVKALNSQPGENTTVDMDPISVKITKLLKADEFPELTQLAQRQEKILQQLSDLKTQIASMRAEIKIGEPAKVQLQQTVKKEAVIKKEPINLKNLKDFVVNCSPSNVPYSILALKKLWIDRLHLEVEFYTHSTVSELSTEAIEFQKQVVAVKPQDEKLPKLKITFIWKNVGSYTEMIVSPSAYFPICGEVNILRFLSRVGPNEFNYEKCTAATEIDSILDACYILVCKNNVKDQQATIKQLNTCLGKSGYFGGDSLSIGDIAATSAMKQMQKSFAKEITPILKKLMHKFAKYF